MYTRIRVASDLDFDWDEANIEHVAGHNLSPAEIEQIFNHDERDIEYDIIGGEQRWTAIGETDAGRVIIVVFTLRSEKIRVVTAFDAGRRLQAEYLQLKGH